MFFTFTTMRKILFYTYCSFINAVYEWCEVIFIFIFFLDCTVYGCLPPTGPPAAEESSSCDLICSSANKEAESKMLSLDPSKETPPSCSLTEEQGNRLPVAKQEQEGN